VEIDWSRLVIQWIVVTVAGTIAISLLHKDSARAEASELATEVPVAEVPAAETVPVFDAALREDWSDHADLVDAIEAYGARIEARLKSLEEHARRGKRGGNP